MTDAPQTAGIETRAGAPAVIHLPDEPIQAPKKTRSGSGRRKRKEGVFVRLLPEQMQQLAAAANDAGFSLPAYLVAGRLGDDAAPPATRRRRLPAINAQALARNNAELNKIGSNLNQAARALNEIALNEGRGGVAQAAHLTDPILGLLDELRLTLAANRRALGYDREG
jgi:hypothetical protein